MNTLGPSILGASRAEHPRIGPGSTNAEAVALRSAGRSGKGKGGERGSETTTDHTDHRWSSGCRRQRGVRAALYAAERHDGWYDGRHDGRTGHDDAGHAQSRSIRIDVGRVGNGSSRGLCHAPEARGGLIRPGVVT